MNEYKKFGIPRLPLLGKLDVTYECNNNCRHCWLKNPIDSEKSQELLSFNEIKRIVDDARKLGCQSWDLSGGEPMLRHDFYDIFDYIIHKSISYSINTNGTLINPKIAKLMTSAGRKMIALYGATAEVHDNVTRRPGSFNELMRGFAYLKEAGARFIVQIVPIKANYHQLNDMVDLALVHSPNYRIGAAWLYHSACHSAVRNMEIDRQRLIPLEVIEIDPPDPSYEFTQKAKGKDIPPVERIIKAGYSDEPIFAKCIANQQEFHIDPYGQMSFCYFIKDPKFRYDLRNGTFQEAWEKFIPSIGELVHEGQEYYENCGSCDLRQDCRWCAVYGYLEHKRYSAKVDYLCQIAKENRKYKDKWKSNHLRYFQIADTSIQVTADFPIEDDTFVSQINKFKVESPGEDEISIRLVSKVPRLSDIKLGQLVYLQSPWAIYKQQTSWIYRQVSEENLVEDPHLLAIADKDHNHFSIYRDPDLFRVKNINSLTSFPSDQILLARVFANRQACYIHSGGIIIDGKGYLFIGHSEAGKSTILKMLRNEGEILCDDRNVIRKNPDGLWVYGTWSHGELPDVSPAGAPLQAIFFIEQSQYNQLIPINNMRDKLGRILSHVVKPFITEDWWEKILALSHNIATEIPAYRLLFDKSGEIVNILRNYSGVKK